MPGYSNTLQISQDGEGIPYGGTGVLRADGDANYGFTNLKGRPDHVGDIPELVRDEALADLVISLNDPQSAFATVGCVSGRVVAAQGYRVNGYVEFAFDSVETVADAANYFPVFFHFDRALHTLKYNGRVQFHWELMSATFIHAQVEGFTVAITVNTDWYPTAEDAGTAWGNGLSLLSGFLRQVPPEAGTRLFNDAMIAL